VIEVKKVAKPTSFTETLIAVKVSFSTRNASRYFDTRCITSDMQTTNMIEGSTVKIILIGSSNNPIPPIIQTSDPTITICGINIPQIYLNAI